MRIEDESPLVSIITPAYNAEEYISSTYVSIKAQTYENWEWIVVDDSSSDRTASIIGGYADEEPRIRFIELDGSRHSAARARNEAMRIAQGSFFAFLDADDLWRPEKTAIQVRYLGKHADADGVCSWYDLFGDEDAMLRDRWRMRSDPICRRWEIVRGCPIQTLTLMIRRHCYDEIGGMDEDPRLYSGQDVEYFTRLICNYRIDRIPQSLAHYRLASLNESLFASHFTVNHTRGWNIFQVLTEKGVFTPAEIRRRKAFLHYEQARENLLYLGGPFRKPLLRSIITGSPPLRAILIAGMSFLPRSVLRNLAKAGLNRFRRIKHCVEPARP